MLRLLAALSDAGLSRGSCGADGEPAEVRDAFAVLGMTGRFAARRPAGGETAGGLAVVPRGIASPAAAMSVAPARPGEHVTLNSDGTLTGRVRAVPFAREVGYLAVLAGGAAETSIALVETAACRVTEGYNLAGDALNPVSFERVEPVRVGPPRLISTRCRSC